jgi:Yippee zinc-binding/DNA-binding /Mis18, centromere assembly
MHRSLGPMPSPQSSPRGGTTTRGVTLSQPVPSVPDGIGASSPSNSPRFLSDTASGMASSTGSSRSFVTSSPNAARRTVNTGTGTSSPMHSEVYGKKKSSINPGVRRRAHSFGATIRTAQLQTSGADATDVRRARASSFQHYATSTFSALDERRAKLAGRDARRLNDKIVYLDGPQIYTCITCRTHLTSHDDIISKSFHGRHGRAYLFDQCVNVVIGPAEDRRLMTGLHSVCDISCTRCQTVVGWTYLRAYESSQKYKEGKYIIEKIHLHLETATDTYPHVSPPAGERVDRWKQRSLSWGQQPESLRPNTDQYLPCSVATSSASSNTTSSSSSFSNLDRNSSSIQSTTTLPHRFPMPHEGALVGARRSSSSLPVQGDDIVYEYDRTSTSDSSLTEDMT